MEKSTIDQDSNESNSTKPSLKCRANFTQPSPSTFDDTPLIPKLRSHAFSIDQPPTVLDSPQIKRNLKPTSVPKSIESPLH